jgi:hypothetical protein
VRNPDIATKAASLCVLEKVEQQRKLIVLTHVAKSFVTYAAHFAIVRGRSGVSKRSSCGWVTSAIASPIVRCEGMKTGRGGVMPSPCATVDLTSLRPIAGERAVRTGRWRPGLAQRNPGLLSPGFGNA